MHTPKKRFFFDTEFIDASTPGHVKVHLISIGVVAESGEKYYAVNKRAPLHLADNFVKEHIIPKLGPMRDRKTMPIIRDELALFIRSACAGLTPEFYAYYADYDWTLFCSIFGGMLSLPKGWPMLCLDLKQEALRLQAPKLPQPKNEHNALSDAEALLEGYKCLQEIEEISRQLTRKQTVRETCQKLGVPAPEEPMSLLR